MSRVTPEQVWYPPEFPEEGRLPSSEVLIRKNLRKQDSQEREYHQGLCLAAGRRVMYPCCKTLHISLFFDGTGNNLNHDLFIADPPNPTNIARLFRATIGQGYAAGFGERNAELVDSDGPSGNHYFKYYMPGVGTPFPEVMDLDFSSDGLAFASGGEARINWALLCLIDALRRTLGKSRLSDGDNWRAVQAMATGKGEHAIYGKHRRWEEFRRQLNGLGRELKWALEQPSPGWSKLLGIKLYVYGFSRGAASARAFVHWLSEQMPEAKVKGEARPLCLPSEHGNIPLSIEFLGLLDTVASVGVAHIAPLAEGHMSWADGTMELPDNGLIKRCVHLVSSHEQRLCFPLDSVCRADGHYPEHCVEVVYPGVHSDLGGGYPPGDQGKAVGENDSLLLSQIPLNDLYAAAFSIGAPLKVPEEFLPHDLLKNNWCVMPANLVKEFSADPELIKRFNGWRQATLGIAEKKESLSSEQAPGFDPIRAPVNLIDALAIQIGWITAWRIHRYARGSFRTQRFYQAAAENLRNQDNDPGVQMARERARKAAQKQVEAQRRELLITTPRGADFVMLPPGPKDFDAALGQNQLLQAAIEFREDYQQQPRTQAKGTTYAVMDFFKGFVYAFNQSDVPVEFRQIKQQGESSLAALFPVQGEECNASDAFGLTRMLFDDHVHDSRAWFMHNALGSREPWGSYFLYRMIYFGESMSKQVRPLAMLGYVAGLGYPLPVKKVRFVIETPSAQQPLTDASSADQCISVVDAESGNKLAVLQNGVQQITCVQHPGVIQAEYLKNRELEWEERKQRLSAFILE